MEKLFIYLESDKGSVLLNLRQIARVDGLTGDVMILHTTDGHNLRIHGREGTDRMVFLLAQYTVTLDGRPLTEVIGIDSPKAPPESLP